MEGREAGGGGRRVVRGRARALLRGLAAVALGTWRRYRRDDCLDRAALLAYTTLLGVVPLLAVGFSILHQIALAPVLRGEFNEFVFGHFLPSTGYALLQELDAFADRATQLGTLGVVGLAVTAMLLLHSMENHFNVIWRARPRRLWRRALRYALVLVLGPLFSALFLGFAWPLLDPWLRSAFQLHLPDYLLAAGAATASYPIEAFAFAALYRYLPAAPVRWRDAGVGGALAALLFELGKAAFAVYLHFSSYEKIYGALGALPVFLVWLYLAWAILLLGAELTVVIGGSDPQGSGSGDGVRRTRY